MQPSELRSLYGDKLDPTLIPVEYEFPDGSGSWVQCERDCLNAIVTFYERQGCRVWVEGELVA